MSEKENLMSGLTILSPEETMAMDTTGENTPAETSAGETIENNETDTPANIPAEEGLTITTPVPSSTAEDLSSNDGSEDTSNSEGSEPSVFSTFIKEMINDGIIVGPEEEEELKELLENANVDTVKKLMKDTVGKTVSEKQDAWKKGLSPDKKKFLEIEDSFTDANDAIRMAQRIDYLDSITNEMVRGDEKVQGNLYYEDLILKGFNHEDAVEAVDEAKALGKLEAKAVKALPSIRKHDEQIIESNKVKLAEDREKLIADNEKAYNGIVESIDNRESFVSGLNLNKTQRDKLKNNMFDAVYEDKDGTSYTSLMYKQKTNPSEFDMLINYYDTLGLFNVDSEGKFKPDISKLKNVAKTKATSELEDVLKRESREKVGQRNSNRTSQDAENVLDFLSRATGHGRKKN